ICAKAGDGKSVRCVLSEGMGGSSERRNAGELQLDRGVGEAGGEEERPWWPPYVQELGPLGVFSQDDLIQDGCFLLDTGGDAVFAWHGKASSQEARDLCVRLGKVYVSSTLVGVEASPIIT
ncbi:unnamed protein product, partial [Discosporangium mesarthrocarpum]